MKCVPWNNPELLAEMPQFSGPVWRMLGHTATWLRMSSWGGDRWLAVLFHHVTNRKRWRADDPCVQGLGVSISAEAFRDRIEWLSRHYDFVSLSELETGRRTPGRPRIILCFDDGYQSVYEVAAPILEQLGIKWCFFLNPALIGNDRLSIDNIVAYIFNQFGVDPLEDFAGHAVTNAHQFIGNVLSRIPVRDRRVRIEGLAAGLGIDTGRLAAKKALFVTRAQVRELAANGIEIGNHTLDHVHCRQLDPTSATIQIKNSAEELEKICGRHVKAFAYPYGSLVDSTKVARSVIEDAGHDCAFVVHNRQNSSRTDPYRRYRVDIGEMDNVQAVLELEVLPRLRSAMSEIKGSFGR
jgi:peptidoglycan/xylan/chitin deacetylase (PgdA/CDA1 family)